MDETNEYTLPPLIISFLLHALIFGVIVFLFSQNLEDGSPNSEPIQIESVKEKKRSVKVKIKNEKELSHTSVNHHGHSVSLSDLGMRLDTSSKPESDRQGARSPFESAPESGSDDWDVLNPDPRVARFNQYIYNTVQGWLDRDSYLNQQKLYGTVKIKIWFTKDGEYLENETNFEAIDSDFEQIVRRALRKSFMNPIPRPFLFQHDKFFIVRTVVLRR